MTLPPQGVLARRSVLILNLGNLGSSGDFAVYLNHHRLLIFSKDLPQRV